MDPTDEERARCGDKRASRSQESSMQVGILDVQCTSVSQYLVIFRYSVMHCSYLTQTPSAPALAIQKNLGRQTQPNEPPDLRYLPCVMQRRILIFAYVSMCYHKWFISNSNLFYSTTVCSEVDRSTATPRTLPMSQDRQAQPSAPQIPGGLSCTMRRRIVLFWGARCLRCLLWRTVR